MGIPALWTETNKAELITLRDVPAMRDTAYGQFEDIRNPRMLNRNHSIITINCCKLIATV